jgi:hypothetical protein
MGTSTRNEFRAGIQFPNFINPNDKGIFSQNFNATLLEKRGRRCGPIRRASMCSALLLVDSDSRSVVMDPWRYFELFPRAHQDL